MNWHEILAKQLMDIVHKQNMAKLNAQMVEICDELDDFIAPIKQCMDADVDLSPTQKARIQELNDQYTSTLNKMKELDGRAEGYTTTA